MYIFIYKNVDEVTVMTGLPLQSGFFAKGT